jgi:hypothetical protein
MLYNMHAYCGEVDWHVMENLVRGLISSSSTVW